MEKRETKGCYALACVFVELGELDGGQPNGARRVVEWYETHITYRHSGEQIAGDMPWYEITDLLEGYGEIES